jgi:hypothetical protein|tara:strand:- start:1304 stop:1573 length:270 start_codon:yes stop_codon:yes gene_type:complete
MALNKNEFLKPVEVQHEFGFKVRMLSYFRECSMDEGKLRGPNFLKDGEVVLYKREWIESYITEKQPFCIMPAQSKQNNTKSAIIHKLQK